MPWANKAAAPRITLENSIAAGRFIHTSARCACELLLCGFRLQAEDQRLQTAFHLKVEATR